MIRECHWRFWYWKKNVLLKIGVSDLSRETHRERESTFRNPLFPNTEEHYSPKSIKISLSCLFNYLKSSLLWGEKKSVCLLYVFIYFYFVCSHYFSLQYHMILESRNHLNKLICCYFLLLFLIVTGAQLLLMILIINTLILLWKLWYISVLYYKIPCWSAFI